jgi:methyl-accepting chemotaxis protein
MVLLAENVMSLTLSFRKKLLLPLLLNMACLVAMSVYSAIQVKQTRLEERKADLVHVSELALATIANFEKQAASGALSEDEAKRRSLDAISAMRYGSNGYIAIFDSTPKVLMHPTKPEMVGKDVGDYRDPNGVPLYRDAVNVVKANGHGFSTYAFPRPGETAAAPKIAYESGYAKWDWVLQTGIYVDDLDAAFRATLWKTAGVMAGIALLLWLIVSAINKSVVGSLERVASSAGSLAQGDLTAHLSVDTDDEIGALSRAVNDAASQLSLIVSGVKTASGSIATSTTQLAAGSADLARRAEEQAASLEQTAASMEELTGTVGQTAENAQAADAFTSAAAQTATSAEHAVTEMMKTMEQVNAGSSQISEITTIIESIAFQTNILALNASVEAARAGEQGRGFAVVANEVRSLAQRCSSAASQINTVIQSSVQQSREGVTQAEQVGASVKEIARTVQRVSQLVGEIASSAQEQRHGIEQVNTAVAQMDRLTQENAALIQQTAEAASELGSEAASLDVAVSKFVLS